MHFPALTLWQSAHYLGHHSLDGSTDTPENWHPVIRCCPCQIPFCRSDQDGARTCASSKDGISARPAYPVSLAIFGLSHPRPQSDIARQSFPSERIGMPPTIDVKALSQPALLSAPDLLTACQTHGHAAIRQPSQESSHFPYLQMAGNIFSGQVVNIHDVQDSFWYSLCIASTSIRDSSQQFLYHARGLQNIGHC